MLKRLRHRQKTSRKNRIRAVAGLLILSVLLLSGCSPKKEAQEQTDREALPLIRMVTYRTTESVKDEKGVEQAASAYLEQELGCRLEIETAVMGNYSQKQSQVFDSEEQADLLVIYGQSLYDCVEKGLVSPLDELLSAQGQGIVKALNRDYLTGGHVDGIRYGVPTVKDYAKQTAFEYRSDIAEKYGLDMESVDSIEGLEDVFLQLEEKTDKVIPVGMQYSFWPRLTADAFGNPFGALMNYGQDTQVVNPFETGEFESWVRRMYEWRQRGWIADDFADNLYNIHYLRSGLVLGCFSTSCPGFDVQESRQTGYPIKTVVLDQACITSDANTVFWTIPKKSQQKEMAMEVLNLLYTDSYFQNLLTYGIEGKHYEVRENGDIGYPFGVNARTSGYAQFLGWMYGNEYITYQWEGNEPNLWKELEIFNDQALLSKAFGIDYEDSQVREEIKACQGVYSQYYSGLVCGRLEPDIYLPLFQKELRKSGIETIIEDKQGQLNQYLSGMSRYNQAEQQPEP